MSEAMLPELQANPFTRVLGRPPNLHERVELLDRRAPYDPSERNLPHTERKYAVLRLLEVSVPVQRQVELVERINMMIRQGYKARDPGRGWHRRQFQTSARALEAMMSARRPKGAMPSTAPSSTEDDLLCKEVEAARAKLPALDSAGAHGLALIGVPGMGKSTTTGIALDGIPQVVVPDTQDFVKQLVWLKIDCPAAPTRRQFCYAAFAAIDLALGTNYTTTLFNQKESAAVLVGRLQNIVVLHAVGLIVIDEIQNVAHSPEDSKTFIDFFVSLVNCLGVPLMLIGTAEARPLLDGAFRLARRSAGIGQPNWDRLQQGEEWDDWLAEMWRYQWTEQPIPLTPEISAAIYNESQGVIDIAVKLLMLAQLRAISRGEAGLPETLDAGMFKTIVEDELALAKPLLEALRGDKIEVLSTIPDLVPLQIHVEQVFSKAMGMTAEDFRKFREARKKAIEAASTGRPEPLQELKTSIISRGYTTEIADRAFAAALKSNSADDTLGLAVAVAEFLRDLRPEHESTTRPKRPRIKPTEDALLTNIALEGDDPIECLRQSGMLVSSVDEIVPIE